jgi:hypothetical protein
MARSTSISSLVPNVNIGNCKSSKDSSSTLSTPIRRNQPSTMARSASEVERHQPSADRRNQSSATAEISISSTALNVNIGDCKSSGQQQHTCHPHQKKSAFRHGMIHQHQLHSSQYQHWQWQEQQGQQQHSCQPRRKKSAFRHGNTHQHQLQVCQIHGSQRQHQQRQGNDKRSKDSSSTSKSKGRA